MQSASINFVHVGTARKGYHYMVLSTGKMGAKTGLARYGFEKSSV